MTMPIQPLSNRAVVETYFHSLATGDLATLGALLDDNVRWHQPGHGSLSREYIGKADVFGLFGEFMTRSAGSFRIDAVDAIMENGPLVSATLRFSAKREGASMEMAGIDLMRVENGTIREVWLFSSDPSAEDVFWG